MKYLMILTIGFCLLIGIVPVMADQAEDEAVIRKVAEQMFAAGNRHDAKALMSFCVEDFASWTGGTKGRAAWEEYMSGIFARQKDIKYEIADEIGINFVAPNVAIYKFRDRTSGTYDADSKPLPPRLRLRADVYVKKDGKWLVAAFFTRPIEE